MDRSRKRDYPFASDCFAQFAADGSNAALTEALAIVAPELLRTAFALTGRADDAAEMVQETFLAAIQSRHRFEAGRELVPWLVGILQNLNRHRRRAQARQIDPEQLLQRSEDEPSTLVDRKLVLEQIERSIDTLPPTYRQVVSLHLRDGMRPEEISRILDRPPGRIRTQLWRGLRQLRDTLPGGLASAVVAFLTVASARAQHAVPVDVTGSDGPPTHPPTRADPMQSQRPRGMRNGARWAAGILTPLALVGTVYWGLGAGAGWAPAHAVSRTATLDPTAPGSLPDAPDEATRRVDVTPDPSAARGSVRVRLVWADTSLPAAHQSVRLQAGFRAGTSLLHTWFDTVRESTTGADGAAAFDNVPAGTARLLFDDALLRSQEFTVPAGGSVDRSETLVPECDIEGIVIDSDELPVAGAEIWLSSTAGLMSPGFVAARAAADGTFALRALSRRWTVWATAPGHARSAVYFEPQLLRLSRPRLVLGQTPATLDGTVRASDGKPLAGALVGVFQLTATRNRAAAAAPAPSFDRADGNGRFRLSGLEPGAVLLVARADSACAHVERIELGPGESAHVDLLLGRGATVHGRTSSGATAVCATPRHSDASTGVLSMLGTTTPVLADGTYSLEHVYPGKIEVGLMRSGASPNLGGTTIDVVDGQTVEVDLQPIRQSLELAGQVVDERGNPLGGIDVWLQPAEFDWLAMRNDFDRTNTDAGGRFRFAAQPGVAYRCFALHGQQGFPLAASDAVVGGNAKVRLTLTDASRATGTIRGTVLDAASSRSPVDVDLCQIPLGAVGRFAVAADGRFNIEPLPPGGYVLLAETQPETRRSRLATFHLDAGQVLDLGALAIRPAGELRSSLRRPDGRPVRVAGFIGVYSHPEGLPLARMLAAPDGAAALQVDADDYELDFIGIDFLPERRIVTVAPGQPSEVVVQLRPARTCSFTFTSPDQRSTGRLWLRIAGSDGKVIVNRALPATAEAAFHVDFGLPPGALHVRAVTPRGLVAEGDVIVPGGDPASGPPLAMSLPLR